jgi:hypothetical protein
MKRSAVITASLGCGLLLSVPALAAGAIAPASLVAHAGELPGFSAAHTKLKSATSASRYVNVVLGEHGHEARTELAKLKRRHLREGVQELLSINTGEALSLALVFATPGDAKAEFRSRKSETVKAQGRAVVDPLAVPAIPGSFGFTAVEAGQSSVAANVLFTTGRCYFVVGNSLEGATREEAATAPLAGASAVYQRVKPLCS